MDLYLKTRTLMLKLNSSASFWNIIYNGLRIGGNILTLPIALRTLSQSEMGLYYTFVAVGGLASFMDMGLGCTVARQAAYIYSGAKTLIPMGVPECYSDGKPDMKLFSKLVSTVRRLFMILGCFTAAILMIPGGIFIGRSILSSGLKPSLIVAWLVFAASVAHSLGTAFWGNFLMGVKKERLSSVIGTYAQAGYIIIVLIGLLYGFGIWSYSIALLISGVAQRNVCKHFFVKHTQVGISQKLDFSMLKSLWPMSWRLWIVLASMYAFQKANVIVSSGELGLQDTAGYGLLIALYNIAYQMISTPLQISFPRISRLRVAGDLKAIRSIFFTRLYGALAVSLLVFGLLIMIGPYLLNLIGAKTHLPSFSIMLVSAIFFLLDRHQGEYFTLVLGENKNPFIIPYVLTALLSISLMTFGGMKYGLMGLIVGQGISQMLINNWWVVYRGWIGVKVDKSK
jgi:O-antigen/teichoic acid export membrane protein